LTRSPRIFIKKFDASIHVIDDNVVSTGIDTARLSKGFFKLRPFYNFAKKRTGKKSQATLPAAPSITAPQAVHISPINARLTTY
jgi:hypothetical protein